MTKYVRDTAAAKSLRAFVIMKGKREVAKVWAHYTSSRCLVNVWQDYDAAHKCPVNVWKDGNRSGFQHATASGYGYDKFTAALAGMWIDGHQLTDHCASRKKHPKGQTHWPHGMTAPKGYTMANWSGEGWGSCYRLSGLDYLRDLGYQIIEVL